MAVINADMMTLLDIQKRLDPHGDPAMIIEVMHQKAGMVDDIPMVEGNLVTGNETVVRTALPSGGTRRPNRGIAPTKSRTEQIVDACAILEQHSQIDKLIADRGSLAANRASEGKAHIEKIVQNFSEMLNYGSSQNEEEFVGFMERLGDLSAANARNIIDAGGTGSDNASILLVGWHPDRVCGIYPEGSDAGLQVRDKGLVMVTETEGAAGRTFEAYLEVYQWFVGLAVKDWRSVGRICNIDRSSLYARSSPFQIIDAINDLIESIDNIESTNAVLYMDRSIKREFNYQVRQDVKAGGQLGYREVFGRRVQTFNDIPIRIVDQMHVDEERVV